MLNRKKFQDEFVKNAKDALKQANGNKLVFKNKHGETHLSLSVMIAFILSVLAPYLAIVIAFAWLLGFFRIEVVRTARKTPTKKKK